jgi:hypothetical protein
VSGDHRYRRIEEKGLKMIRFIAGFEEPPKGRSLLAAWNTTDWVKKTRSGPTTKANPARRAASGSTTTAPAGRWPTRSARSLAVVNGALTTMDSRSAVQRQFREDFPA